MIAISIKKSLTFRSRKSCFTIIRWCLISHPPRTSVFCLFVCFFICVIAVMMFSSSLIRIVMVIILDEILSYWNKLWYKIDISLSENYYKTTFFTSLAVHLFSTSIIFFIAYSLSLNTFGTFSDIHMSLYKL